MAVRGTYESFKSILITCVDAETRNPYSEDTKSLGGEPAKAFANVETVDADIAETESRAWVASDDLAIANANTDEVDVRILCVQMLQEQLRHSLFQRE